MILPRIWIRLAPAVLAGISHLGCTVSPTVSDTGYTGTWARVDGKRNTRIAIFKDDERYLIRWGMETTDGKWIVRCGWDGRCEEFLEGKKVAEIEFEVRRDPGDGHLTVEVARKPTDTGEVGYHYTDEMFVEPGGKRLLSYTVELNGKEYPKETATRYIHNKVADGVAEPPVAGGRS